MAHHILLLIYRHRTVDPRNKRTGLAFIPFAGCGLFFFFLKQIVIIPRTHCSAARSDFKAFCTMAKLHPMLSEMCISILLMRWVFLSLQSPAGSGQDGGRSPRSPPGDPGHTWAPRAGAGTAAAAQPGPAPPKFPEGPFRVEPGRLQIARRQFSLRSPSLLLPLRHSPPSSIGSSLLLARRCRERRPPVCAQGLGWGNLPDRHLECLCPPPRPAEAPRAPQPTTRGDNKADVHHVAGSFQKGQILTPVPQVEACFGLALWAPFTPTFTQMRMNVYIYFPPAPSIQFSFLSSISPLAEGEAARYLQGVRRAFRGTVAPGHTHLRHVPPPSHGNRSHHLTPKKTVDLLQA